MAYLRAAENSIHRSFFNSIPGDIRYMFAYGSGVFKQSGHSDKKVCPAVRIPLRMRRVNLSLAG